MLNTFRRILDSIRKKNRVHEKALAFKDHSIFSNKPNSIELEFKGQLTEDREPAETDLLQCGYKMWKAGDWEALAELKSQLDEDHPQRGHLALLIASGSLQLGDVGEARKLLMNAAKWGCDRELISRFLISGVYSCLSRAATVSSQREKALKNYNIAIETVLNNEGVPSAPNILQSKSSDLVRKNSINDTSKLHKTENSTGNSQIEVSLLDDIVLGEAWAGNTINTAIFRSHGVLTRGSWQYAAYYINSETLQLVQRHILGDAISFHQIKGQYNLMDGHNGINLGIDRFGCLHICYDHHATRLRYRRSTKPESILDWTEELSMTGADESKITYPSFILPRLEFPLTIIYRDGGHDRGTVRMKSFDEVSGKWADHPKPILSGSDLKPWTANAYWNRPAIGLDGSIHLAFVWRTHLLGEGKLINNINIGYATSLDNGKSWVTSLGRPYQLPITPVNAETIYAVSPGSNLINQSGMSLDSQGRPHIVFYSNDEDGVPQYQHIWYVNGKWKQQFLSRRASRFDLTGNGTLKIPISRPEIIIDRMDNIYIIFRGDLSQNRMVAMKLIPPNYDCLDFTAKVLIEDDVGYAEPVIDHARWAHDNVLTLLMQYSQQPNNDVNPEYITSQVRLVDFRIS